MTNKLDPEDQLDVYFAAGKKAKILPSNDLMGRILDDAENALISTTPKPAERTTAMGAFWNAIGGWPAAAGMAVATLVGVWIGFSQPAGLDLITTSYLGADNYLVDFEPAFGADIWEG